MLVSSPQRDEDIAFVSVFPLGGIHSQGILLVISLELQGKSINTFLWYSLKHISRSSLQRKNGIKTPYFHYAVDMKQSHSMADFCKNIVYSVC